MAERPRPRVFLDTNVIFSGLYSDSGPPARTLRLHAQRLILIVISRQVLAELVRTLRRKLPAALPALRTFLLNAPPEVIPDPPHGAVATLQPSVNPMDAPIIAAALSSGAEFLVSGDLRFLREVRGLNPQTRPVSPLELLNELGLDA